MSQSTVSSLPEHDVLSLRTRILEVLCIVTAVGLLIFHIIRLAAIPDLFNWWMLLAILTGLIFADFASGIIHWIADTWGSETMPVLGRRFLRPFRVHHVNPHDFLKRNFIDTNGDVAMLCIPFLLLVFLIPLDHELGRTAAVFLLTFCAGSLPTNQVHQWAHMPQPPAWVLWLQGRGLLLSRQQHQVHHTAPFATNYCIATGWCNRPLAAIHFFPIMERLITRITGAKPRSDDLVFATQAVPAMTSMDTTALSIPRSS